MAKRQLPKRLFKQEHESSYRADRSPASRMKQITRDHQDVLQNIEFALVKCRKEDRRVDDRAVDEALGAAIGQAEAPGHAIAADVFGGLAAIRKLREDVDDDLWRNALRVVRDSVHAHSKLRPGETSYLDFVAPFVP